DVAAGPDQDLRVVDEIALPLAQPGGEDEAVPAREAGEMRDAGAVRHGLGELRGVRRAVAVEDELREQDELGALGGGPPAPPVDLVEDPCRFAQPSVHAHRGDARRPHAGYGSVPAWRLMLIDPMGPR